MCYAKAPQNLLGLLSQPIYLSESLAENALLRILGASTKIENNNEHIHYADVGIDGIDVLEACPGKETPKLFYLIL